MLDLLQDPNEFENKIDQEKYQRVLAEMRNRMIEHILPSVLA